MELILASKSPRRSSLLHDAGFNFTVAPSKFDESTVSLDHPEYAVENLALGKARDSYNELPSITKLNSVVLGADTIVVCDGVVMLKPKDKDDAKRMLHELSGKVHQVYTGIAFVSARDVYTEVVKTDVEFYELTDEEIDEYVASGEPLDKAGAYGIQGNGCTLVKRIDGDFYSVVGLPLAPVVKYLKRCGVRQKRS
ncbi:MAG: Maf family protein [Clostridia bacterium]|nr:Maf family protein [Clostridia bacterium]